MGADIVKIILGLTLILVQLAMLAGYVALAFYHRKAFVSSWRPALVFSLALFILGLPNIAFSIAFLDPSGMPQGMEIGLRIGLVLAVFLHVVRIAWHQVLYVVAAAEWQRAGVHGFGPRRPDGRLPWRELVGGFAFGVFAASVTLIVFFLVGVEEGEMVSEIRKLFPGATEASLFITLPVVVSFFSYAALSEELTFRGGLLGLSTRLAGHRVWLRWAGFALLSLLWAVAHLPNTQMPVVKGVQILAIGLVLCELTRRCSLHVAMSAHLGLNLASAFLGFVWRWLH